MRIALVGAEFEENLSLRTIQAQLLSEGHDVDLVPFNERGEIERVSRRLAASGADVVGMSLVFTLRAREFADLACHARALGLRAHVTAGGHFAAFHAHELLTEIRAFDSVALGEGEWIMSDLCRNLGQLDRVSGLMWRRSDGTFQENPPAEKPFDLDALPPPTHKDPFDRFLGLPIANLLRSRGCTHACAFCSIAAWHSLVGGPRLRCRRPESIAREMRSLHGRGVRIFNFHDDNFLMRSRRASLDRVSRLTRALEDERLGRIAFAIKARPDSVDPEVFTLLKEAGLFRVFLGIEAGTTATLTALGRGQSPADNERALGTVNGLDLHACFNLLLFGPDSTLEEILADIDFLHWHPDNPMNFCRTEVYAGTPLAAKLAREERLIGDFWGYDYRIRDPRAQLLFEIVYLAFRHRNYGLRGLHHRAMAVDYEHQLLSHFWGRDERLRRKVKGFVRDVNRNTSEHLLAIATSVASGDVTPAVLADVVPALTRTIERDSARLGRRAESRQQGSGATLPAPRRGRRGTPAPHEGGRPAAPEAVTHR